VCIDSTLISKQRQLTSTLPGKEQQYLGFNKIKSSTEPVHPGSMEATEAEYLPWFLL